MTRARLSVVVVTLNEEEQLRACLETVAWADELIVVDALSQDKTAQIAREFTDRVIVRPWPGFAAQKNFGVGEAGGDWILSLDADEQVSAELRDEIVGVLADDLPHDGYRAPRRNIFWGQWVRHGDLHQVEHALRVRQRRGTIEALVQPHALGDLLADGEHRVQARHRLLEDHRQLVAAQCAHARLG